MRLLIFLVLSQYGLACKYGIIFQISIYDWAQKLHFLTPGITIANLSKDISNIKSYIPSNTRCVERHRNTTSLNRQKISSRTR